ncbi:MAG TPA: M14 family zinc carboxypeptidase [Chthoniobacteraceae bacterium]|nr:M14 family zinc carboxypeptidase [Chthoniobacteraceae bacterium]
MLVKTDIPCGNGRIKWLSEDQVEIEVIAYSKGARYTYFKVSDVQADGRKEIILRPDPYFHLDFTYFHGKIWVKRGKEGTWNPLSKGVEITPHAIRIDLDVRKGEECFVSTEPPREYVQTCRKLFAIAAQMPEAASIHCIGHSIEQRPIFLLRVTDHAHQSPPGCEEKPVIMLCAGEHATEFAGEELIRGMLAAIIGESDDARELRRSFIFDIVLNVNPDGNFHGWHQYNRKDWLEHNYSDGLDRSWHHEFGHYFAGRRENLSPETEAIGKWVETVRPRFLVNAHSWLGHHGNPGAFRVEPETLRQPLKGWMQRLDQAAKAVAKTFDVEFDTRPSNNTLGHLGEIMMKRYHAPAYTIEGHMNLGRKGLQTFGARLLEQWLVDLTGTCEGDDQGPFQGRLLVGTDS